MEFTRKQQDNKSVLKGYLIVEYDILKLLYRLTLLNVVKGIFHPELNAIHVILDFLLPSENKQDILKNIGIQTTLGSH